LCTKQTDSFFVVYTLNSMKNKYLVTVILIIVVLLLALIWQISFKESAEQAETFTDKIENIIDKEQNLNFCREEGINDINSAVKTNDVYSCNCLDSKYENDCIDKITDNKKFTEAIERSDDSICLSIFSKELMESCLMIISQKEVAITETTQNGTGTSVNVFNMSYVDAIDRKSNV
jgi:hypothetical protein